MNFQNFKALPLITYSNTQGYTLHEEAVQMLKILPDTDDYSVVSIVGKSKTGKSFLLNQLMGDLKMFPTSSHLGNCTRGITIATKFVEVDSMKVLFLDTEGFGCTEGNDDRDCKLFILSLLLSSVLIYNSIGTIDEQTLNSLSMIIEVGKLFEKELEKKNSIPALFWALRDFSLQLQDKNGFQISSSEYPQNSLEEQKGASQAINHKNRIRRVIKTMFTQRCCQTLVLPSQQMGTDDTEIMNVRSQFSEDVKRFKKRLFGMVKKKGVKQFVDRKMTISSFLEAIEVYLNCFNKSMRDGTIPKIENITFQMRQYQSKNVRNKFTQFLQQQKQSIIEQLVINKEEQGQTPMLQIFKNIQNFYKDTKNSLYQLTGQINDKQMENKRKQFYQEVQKKSASIVKQRKQRQKQKFIGNQVQINNICEFFNHILDEEELDHQYSLQLHKLKEKGLQCEQLFFANMLMKIEIAYLRRKIEISKEINLQNQKINIELSYAKKQIARLQTRNKQLQELTMKKEQKSNFITPMKQSSFYSNGRTSANKNTSTFGKQPGYIRTNPHNQNQEPKNLWKTQSLTKIESSSLYVPYVLIHKSQYLGTRIIRTLVKEDSKRNTYIEYVIDVNLQCQKWGLNRKFKDFSELHSILIMMFQGENLPQCKCIVKPLKLSDSNSKDRKEVVEQRRLELQNYLTELILIENIRNSRIFQKFLKINKEYSVI